MRDLHRIQRAQRPEAGQGGTGPGEERVGSAADELELRSADGRLKVPLDTGGITIGRAAENRVVLHDRGVSAHHCQVELQEGRLLIIDRGSRNGTFVNGLRVALGELTLGTELLIGRTRLLALSPQDRKVSHVVVGRDASLLAAFDLVARVAPSRAAVLVLGESGTGKELVARELHERSERAARPFVTVNCGAITRELAESELFGHERGAFTGAIGRRRGAFEEAHTGTLFLDEIGELPRSLQPKLLRVIETGEVRPVGASRDLRVDVRLVSATNRDLLGEIERNRFRLDLYHRLAHVIIDLPPLRERLADLPLLCRHFLSDLAPAHGVRHISGDTMAKLANYGWPGNVRELRAAILRAMLLSPSELEPAHLLPALASARPRRLSTPRPGLIDVRGKTFDEIEQAVLRDAVDRAGGNRTIAAQALSVPKSTLADKLRKAGI